MQVTFNIDQLRAALLASAKDDISYYLNGVYVESNSGTTRMCGTNGHYLLAVDYRHGDKEDWAGHFIIPRDVCEMVAKGKYQLSYGTIEIERDYPGSIVGASSVLPHVTGVMRVQGTVIGFSSVAGVFPDYTRIITPWVGDDTDMKAAQFNPSYIGVFQKIAKVLGSKLGYFTLWQRGEDSALVKFDAMPDSVDAVGVLMPLGGKSVDLNIPCTTQFRTKLAIEADGIAQTKDVEPVDSAQSVNHGA